MEARTPMRRVIALLPLSSALALAAAGPASAPSPSAPVADAVRLYDQGRYDEARKALDALDAQGGMSGPLLYRLYFCALVARDEAAAQGALDRARQTLEKENAAATSLEVPFYLANTYLNMGRPSEAREVASRATGNVESGAWPSPGDFMGRFQLAKLYQDQSKDEA